MRKSAYIPAAFIALFSLISLKTLAQIHSPAKGYGDTTTYTLYANSQNFDSKRTVVIEDKHSVDSLANVLATQNNKLYRIIYQKENQQARVISAKYLRGLSTTGFYRITIAYNKPEVMDEQKPIYIITSK